MSWRLVEISWLPHFLDNRLTDGGEVLNLKLEPPFASGRFLGLIPVTGRVDPKAIM
jgi:hypothetical protein